MNLFICLALTIFSCCYCWAQSPYDHGFPYYPTPVKGQYYVDIQYLEVNKNKFFVERDKKYIQEQTDSSALFKSGFGFLVVEDIVISSKAPYFIRKKRDGEHSVDIKFRIGTRSYLQTQSFITLSSYCTGCFPDFYSLIDGRLVLFYSDQSRWLHQGYFSEESKRNLIALQRSHLLQALDPSFVFIDFFGKAFTITPEERSFLTEDEIIRQASFTLQSTKTVIQYLDGQVEYQY